MSDMQLVREASELSDVKRVSSSGNTRGELLVVKIDCLTTFNSDRLLSAEATGKLIV